MGVRRRHLHKGNVCSAFRQVGYGGRGKDREINLYFSQLPSAQNNPNAGVAYFEVAYPEPLQSTGKILFERIPLILPGAMLEVFRLLPDFSRR